ncbi:MAG: hypothetical protein RLN87_00340 [Parasphingopyxis sp.]|uniref:hypothetical protein n=1 Tax=Parasphingopyxis sp. TaxID=1920299 RepID=UPI0032ECF1C6
MRGTTLAIVAVLGLAGAGAGAALADDGERALPIDTRMDRLLAGKTPGPAERCIPRRFDSTIIDEDTILFRENTSVVYRSEIPGGCPGLDHDRAIEIRQTGTHLCAGDAISVFDTQTGADYGRCSIGEFVPYRREG